QARPEILRQRKQLVEHVFGTLKRHLQHGYFLLKTLPKVRAEFSLSVLTYNLKRAIAIVSVPKLVAALREHSIGQKPAFAENDKAVLVRGMRQIYAWFCSKTMLNRNSGELTCRVFTHSDAVLDGCLKGCVQAVTEAQCHTRPWSRIVSHRAPNGLMPLEHTD